jgi:hypothetical protein
METQPFPALSENLLDLKSTLMKLAGEEVRDKGKNLPEYAELLQHDCIIMMIPYDEHYRR